MKLLELDLKAFGPFTHQSLDLSQGNHGLHIVYGANEAGKSSALRAITDFFFGIPARTPDNFIHPYKQMRIGATLQRTDGTTLKLIRRKGNRRSLRHDDDVTAMDEKDLQQCLANVDRDFFHTMFGIDHERLRRGGEQIVQGGGQLGQLLFAAGSGIRDLRHEQAQLQQEMDQLMRPSGRSGRIIDKISEYKAHRQTLKESLVSVDTWSAHDRALRRAQHEKQLLDEQIRKTKSQQNRLTRMRNAVPAIDRWRTTKQELAQVADAPSLPQDFADTAQRKLIELRTAEQQVSDTKNLVAKLNEALEQVRVSNQLLRESEVVENLRVQLGGYQKAMQDRPKLETKREQCESKAREILRKLGRSPDLAQVEQLRLPAHKTVRIQNLGNQREGLIQRCESERRGCDQIRQKIERTQQRLDQLPSKTEGGDIQAVVREIQESGDLDAELRVAKDELSRLEEEAAISLNKLTLWSGTLTEIESLPVPDIATIDRFVNKFQKAHGELNELENRLQAVVSERKEIEGQLRQLELEHAVPTEEALQVARRIRDRGWQLVLESWQDGKDNAANINDFITRFPPSRTLAEAVHESMAEADRVADALRNDADRVATKAKLQIDKQQHESREEEVIEWIDKAKRRLAAIEQRWNDIWNPLGIVPLTPQEMLRWLRHQQDTAEAARRVRECRHRFQRLLKTIDDSRAKVSAALHEINFNGDHSQVPLRDLLRFAASKADEIKERNTLIAQLNENLEGYGTELSRAESGLSEAEAELRTWQLDWRNEMKRLGLNDTAAPSEANSVLTDINDLAQKYHEADELRTRIEGIDSEARQFEDEVRKLAEAIAPEQANASAERAISEMVSAIQATRAAEEHRATLAQQRDEQNRKLADVQSRLSQIRASLDEMCRQACCTQYEQLIKAARRSSRRRELEDAVRDYQYQIVDQCSGAQLETFVAEVEHEASDMDSLKPRIDELELRLGELHNQRDELVRQIEREETALQAIDGSARAAEAAASSESVAARLEDQIHQLAVLRVSSLLLKTSIEEYRKNNQAPLLTRASELFRQLTIDAFTGLRADFGERGEPVLTGIRNGSGDTVEVAGMSDGTCDQLYLALRLASLEKWLDHHEPLPFIVDDVLLNFDDDRAVAGLQVLADLSCRTQVVFFTHHRHLVELAQNECSRDDLFITTLPSSALQMTS